jgi:hypothetical protein
MLMGALLVGLAAGSAEKAGAAMRIRSRNRRGAQWEAIKGGKTRMEKLLFGLKGMVNGLGKDT